MAQLVERFAREIPPRRLVPSGALPERRIAAGSESAVVKTVVSGETEPTFEIGTFRDYVFVAFGPGTAESIVAGLAGGNADAAQQVVAAFPKLEIADPVWRLRVSAPPLIDFVRMNFPVPELELVLGAFGLDNVVGYFSAAGFDGNEFVSHQLVPTNGPPKGLLAMYAARDLVPDDFAWIPADATYASVHAYEYRGFLGRYRKILGDADERVLAMFDEQLQTLEREIGFSLERDLFDLLGDSFAVWQAPSEGGFLFTGLVASVTVTDEARVRRTIDRLLERASGELNRRSQDGRRRRGAHLDRVDVGGVEMRTVSVVGESVPFAPAFAVHHGRLWISLYPQTLRTILERGTPPTPSLAGVPIVANRPAGSWLAYADLPSLFDVAWPLAQVGFSMAANELQNEGLDVLPDMLPPGPSVRRHLTPWTFTGGVGDIGMTMTSRGPLPILDPMLFLAVPLGIVGGMTAARIERSVQHDIPVDPHDNDLATLLSAISDYEQQHGSRPKRLADLGPDVVSGDLTRWHYFAEATASEILLATPLFQGRRTLVHGDGMFRRFTEAQFQDLLKRQKR